MEKVIEYCEQNKDRFLEEYKEFLRFESISADPESKQKVAECANWLADHLRALGVPTVEIHQTKGHPIVFAEQPGPAGAPTVLVYGHYDVQPVDPVDLWHSPPFEPTIRDGKVFARGSADDKGQLFLYIKALEAYLKTGTELPVTLKMVFEGEEEVGSENLAPFIEANAEKLACDVVLVSDTSQFAAGLPTITYGLRGLTYMQIELQGASGDLHSGSFGGAVANPINELAAIIATMKDDDQHITIDGFYDDVLELTDQEREGYAALPFNDEEFLDEIDAPKTWGEAGFTTLERLWARPTLDVNGIWGGFAGTGAKTVLPSKAGAKISMRLVPNQDPKKIAELFEKHVYTVAGTGVRVKVDAYHFGKPFLCPLNNPMLQAAARALESAYGKAPVCAREGGSIPIVADFNRVLGAPILLVGYSVPNENAHAPNEFFLLENFFFGIKSSAHMLSELAKS